jgi:hypothetical protein
MSLALLQSFPKSRLKALLEHFADIEDPREPWRVAHPLAEVLLLVVCGTICDCEDYDIIAEWGKAHLAFLRGYLPYHHGVPCGRWLTLLMNRYRSWSVRGRLHILGSRDLAGSAGFRCDRRQDLAPQSRSRSRHAAIASGVGVRHHDAPRAWAGSCPR